MEVEASDCKKALPIKAAFPFFSRDRAFMSKEKGVATTRKAIAHFYIFHQRLISEDLVFQGGDSMEELILVSKTRVLKSCAKIIEALHQEKS